MSDGESIKKNLILSTAYQILLLITPLITAPYVSRVLTPDGVGVYSYTQSIQLYFSLVAALGTVSYGSREIARVRHDKEQRSKLFWEIELMTVLTTVAVLLVWVGLILFTKEYKICFLMLSLNIIAVIFDISWFYTGLEQFKYIVFQNGSFKILSVVSIFLFVKDENDLYIYILILGLSVFLGNLTMWMYLPKFLNKVSIKDLKIVRHFKETLVYFVPTIATSVYTLLDKTLIGLITDNNSENGYYEQATKIINMAKSVTFTALNSVLGSRISYLFAENRISEIKEKIENSIDYILFMGIGIGFGLIGIADRFVPFFFGDGYDKVAILLCVFSPIVVIIGISNCLGSQYYNPAGLRALSAKFIIVGSCVNLLLNILFIPRYGCLGAAVASVLAELTITVLYIAFCNKYVTVNMLFKYGYKRLIAGLFMLGAMILVNGAITSDVVATAIEFILGCGVYFVVLTLFKDTLLVKIIDGIKAKLKKA
ncbi:MAG: flippase [Wujia sp.]